MCDLIILGTQVHAKEMVQIVERINAAKKNMEPYWFHHPE